MGALNKANARQNTKHKNAFKTYADRNMRMVNKLKRMCRTLHKQVENSALRKQLFALASANIHAAKMAKCDTFIE